MSARSPECPWPDTWVTRMSPVMPDRLPPTGGPYLPANSHCTISVICSGRIMYIVTEYLGANKFLQLFGCHSFYLILNSELLLLLFLNIFGLTVFTSAVSAQVIFFSKYFIAFITRVYLLPMVN